MDITDHSNGPRLRRTVDLPVERTVPRMLEHSMHAVPPRDEAHEVAPHIAPPLKTGGQLIIEQTIGHMDKATDIVLDMIQKLEEELARTREVVMTSKIHVHDVIRSHMIISETAMKSTQQIAQQLVEATNVLATRSNGQ